MLFKSGKWFSLKILGLFPFAPKHSYHSFAFSGCKLQSQDLCSSWEQLNLLAKCLMLGWGQIPALCLPVVNGPTVLTRFHGHIIAIYFNSIAGQGGTWESLVPLSAQGIPGVGRGCSGIFPAWSWTPTGMEMGSPAKAGLPQNFLPPFFYYIACGRSVSCSVSLGLNVNPC